MDKRRRAELFTRYVGLELKGKIISRGFTAAQVAVDNHRSIAAFNRWLNGKVQIPLAVLCEACETIGVEPRDIVQTAYDRVVVECGEITGETYDDLTRAESAAHGGEASVVPFPMEMPTAPGTVSDEEIEAAKQLPYAARPRTPGPDSQDVE